jgi:hypothetical protein
MRRNGYSWTQLVNHDRSPREKKSRRAVDAPLQLRELARDGELADGRRAMEEDQIHLVRTYLLVLPLVARDRLPESGEVAETLLQGFMDLRVVDVPVEWTSRFRNRAIARNVSRRSLGTIPCSVRIVKLSALSFGNR